MLVGNSEKAKGKSKKAKGRPQTAFTDLVTHVTQLKCLKESENESALADEESKAPDEARAESGV
ncbi:MAG: hypothetical protein AUG51_14945 [Acidobacteria bacterium 13_1_20CM_3_53_8]|nr:MAG: hypothetical protein AUG51_14945 [Acidobacteria bacterium 13_1_20CM_3_53_8]